MRQQLVSVPATMKILLLAFLLAACAPVVDETDAVLLAIEGASYLYGQTRTAEDGPVEASTHIEACQQGDPDACAIVEAESEGNVNKSIAQMSELCAAGDAEACELRLILLAEREARRKDDFTPLLRYHEDACQRGVQGACKNAEEIRELMPSPPSTPTSQPRDNSPVDL